MTQGGRRMEDRYGRQIDYLRISVTDRCNLRCIYCMPAEGVADKAHEEILRFEEILKVVQAALQIGINKFRLTGGEPLLRKDIISFIRALALLPGVADLAVTTNGTLLNQLGEQLWDAGVNRLNISLDTLDPDKFQRITRRGDFQQVWQGILNAVKLGFQPIKLNVVALKGFNDSEWTDFARLTLDHPLHVRFIELMPIGTSWNMTDSFVSCVEVRETIEREFSELEPVHTVQGSGPAEYYTLQEAEGTIGFIHAMSNHFCKTCNRLRLTADGKLRPCLHDQHEVDLRGALRSGASAEELQRFFSEAIALKPANHHVATGASDGGRGMCQIGG